MNADASCAEHGLETLWGGFCTHGSDVGLPDATSFEAPDRLDHDWETGDLCDGDGESGKRIQLIYAHASDQSDSSEYTSQMLINLGLAADRILFDSAAKMGGNRHLRYVHDEQCRPTILNVTLSPTGDDHFGTTIHEMFNLGFNRNDRKYLVFMESYLDCGVATTTPDDQPGTDNANNKVLGFARVDRSCWDSATTAHEIMHMLGGVQNSAPNTSGGHHCTDEWDIMCYSDEPNFPVMRIVCPNYSDLLFDCNGDDYFNPHPEPGSYLDTHWNTANSQFLLIGPDRPPCPDAHYEDDHNYDNPRFFPIGSTETHAFCEAFDFDMVAIRARAGVTYRIETLNLSPNTNTGLSLYRDEEFGSTFLKSDDNGNGGLASRIEYTSPTDSLLYALVEQRGFGHAIDLTYDLRITRPVNDTTPSVSTAAISPPPGATGWHKGPVTIDLGATDNARGSGVHALTWSATGAQTIVQTTLYRDSASVVIDQPGTTTVTYFSTDQNFNVEQPKSVTIRIDSKRPTATAPRPSIVLGTHAVGTRVPVAVSWSGADTGGSGVVGYRLQRSSDQAVTWTAIALVESSDSSANILVPAGRVMFRVRTVDGAGNLGPWVTGPELTLETHQENSTSVALSANWKRQRSAGAFGGHVASTGTAGATATLTFRGRSVAWITATVPAHRIAELWLDGVLVDTVDLFSTDPHSARVVWMKSFGSPGKHTLMVRLKYGSSEPTAQMIVDGFVITK